MSADPLITERLVLRRFTAHDGPSLVALDADPEVVRYAQPELIDAPPSLDDIETGRLPALLRGYEQDPPRECWAVCERNGGAFAGWVFLRPLEGEEAWELGYRFRRGVWGRGIATEACRAALTHGFCAAGVRRAVAFVDAANARSLRVAEKLGFHEVEPTAADRRLELAEWPCA